MQNFTKKSTKGWGGVIHFPTVNDVGRFCAKYVKFHVLTQERAFYESQKQNINTVGDIQQNYHLILRVRFIHETPHNIDLAVPSVRLSVCLSVRLHVTLRCCVKTAKHIVVIISTLDSPIILVFLHYLNSHV